MKFNHDEYKKFVKAANEKDYVLMSDLLSAAKDYSLGCARVNLGLFLWETTEKGKELVEIGVAVAESPIIACMKVVEYLSSIYEVKIFDGDYNNIEEVKAFCREYVEEIFNNRKK